MKESASSSSQWRTPNANNGERGGSPPVDREGHTLNLQDQVQDFPKSWTTPDASVSNDGEEPQTFFARQKELKAKGINGNGMGMPLAIAAKAWPRPTTRDWKDTGNLENMPENFLLGRVAANWSSPRASDGEKGSPNQSFISGGTPLPAQAISFHQVHPIYQLGGVSSHPRRSLNPRFVSWLMNWCVGYTELSSTDRASINSDFLAMEWCRYRQRTLCAFYLLGLPLPAPKEQLSFL